jgi:hypothetical protein
MVSVPSGTEQQEHELAALAGIHSSIMTQSVRRCQERLSQYDLPAAWHDLPDSVGPLPLAL